MRSSFFFFSLLPPQSFYNYPSLNVTGVLTKQCQHLFEFDYRNFPGHSGKFFFDGSSGKSFSVRLIPYAPLSIKYDYLNVAPYAGITRFNIADDRGNTYAFGDARIETTTTASGGVPGLTPVNTAWMLENLISQNRRDTVSFMYNTQSVNMPEADSEIYTVIGNVNNMLENDYIPSYSSAKTVSGFRIASAAYFHI